MKNTNISEAISAIKDNATVVVGGAGAGHAVPDKILEALGLHYNKTGRPRNLTFVNPCGVGDNDSRGLNHVALPGLVKRDIGGFWGNAPRLCTMVLEEQIEGYNFPQGVLTHLMRAIAGGEKGLLTKVGLNTFVDPTIEGGKINSRTKEDLVERVKIDGEDQLFFKSYPIDVAIIRGSYADVEGNITMEEEVGTFSMLTLVQAAKVNRGIVIAQVKKIRPETRAKPERVKIPAVLVDYIIEDPEQSMTFITHYSEALIDRSADFERQELELTGIKKVIARRAAMEVKPNVFINLGYGMPDGVPIVINEEGMKDQVTFMIEQGQIDGILTTGLNFGAMYNPAAIIDDGYQFDFFHGGGLDLCYLGFAQVDRKGNVNSSRFGKVLTGCGGFIDISQNAKKVVFCGAFAAKGEVELSEKGLTVRNPGKYKKFVETVQQVTFNGPYAAELGKEVYYVTERAVFQLTKDGIQLLEIVPGADLQRDILDMMEFKPIIKEPIPLMDKTIFQDGTFNLVDKIKT